MLDKKTIEQKSVEFSRKTDIRWNSEAKMFSYYSGFTDCQKEYEEKLRWIPVEECLPKFDKSKYPNGDYEKYEVKYCTGGMSQRYFIQISHLIREDKFSGEFDLTQATHWRHIPFL